MSGDDTPKMALSRLRNPPSFKASFYCCDPRNNNKIHSGDICRCVDGWEDWSGKNKFLPGPFAPRVQCSTLPLTGSCVKECKGYIVLSISDEGFYHVPKEPVFCAACIEAEVKRLGKACNRKWKLFVLDEPDDLHCQVGNEKVERGERLHEWIDNVEYKTTPKESAPRVIREGQLTATRIKTCRWCHYRKEEAASIIGWKEFVEAMAPAPYMPYADAVDFELSECGFHAGDKSCKEYQELFKTHTMVLAKAHESMMKEMTAAKKEEQEEEEEKHKDKKARRPTASPELVSNTSSSPPQEAPRTEDEEEEKDGDEGEEVLCAGTAAASLADMIKDRVIDRDHDEDEISFNFGFNSV
jgi:hypothetical protein